MSIARVVINIKPGDDFEEKLNDFFYWSGEILNHLEKKPEKIKKSYLKKLN